MPEEIVESMVLEAARDSEWLAQNYERLRRQHPDTYVAVKGGDIVATAKSLDGMMDALEEKGVDPTDVFIEFLPKERVLMVV